MLLEEFLGRIEKTPSGCWLWDCGINNKGYGHVWHEGKRTLAHRYCYEQLVGPIPEEKPELDHLCRIPNCVNPKHLEPVTREENCRRYFALITHCPQGHEYSE